MHDVLQRLFVLGRRYVFPRVSSGPRAKFARTVRLARLLLTDRVSPMRAQEINVKQVQVTFRGIAPTATLQDAASKSAREFLRAGSDWISCHLVFEKPATFASGDELWVHLDVQTPGQHVSITRTKPVGGDPVLQSTEEFVRQTFLGARRAIRTSGASLGSTSRASSQAASGSDSLAA